MQTKTEIDCPVCGSSSKQIVLVKLARNYARCLRCNLIYQDPPPPPEETGFYYERGYYESFGNQNESIQKGRSFVYDDFFLRGGRSRPKGRLLDIGCGHGDFLKRAVKEGWEVWGIEPSGAAAEAAKRYLGERVFHGTVETADFPEKSFEAVTLWNVIDCLPDPQAALRKISCWLAPGGLLMIRTPNASFHLRICRFHSRFRSLLEPLGWRKEASVFLRSNFDAKALSRLLQDSGFSCVKIRNGRPTQGDAYQVFSHSGLMGFGKVVLYFVSYALSVATGRRFLIGSTLLAQASKGDVNPGRLTRFLRRRIILKSAVLHGLAVLGYLLGLPLWRKRSGREREIPALLYHSVSEYRENDVNVRESAFRRQLDFLKHHYRIVSLTEAVRYLEKKESPPEKIVAITFDDGYQDNYTTVFPILKEKGIPATIFLLTGGESGERCLTHLMDDQPQYNQLLSWDQVREMAASGIQFGSHGETHSILSQLSPEEAHREIFASKKRLELETRQSAPFFSYPFGTRCDFGSKIRKGVEEAGYQAAFSAIFGTNGKRTDRYALRRIGIEASDNLFTFRAKLNGALGLLSLLDFSLIRRMIRFFDSIFMGKIKPNRPKKDPILLVSVDFPPHTDGVSTISRELSIRIAQGGTPVFVMGPKDQGDRIFDASQPYRIFRLPGYSWGYFRFIPILFWMPFVIWRFGIRKIFAMNIAYGGVLSWLLSHGRRLEYLLFAYGYEFEKVKSIPFARRLYLKIYGRAKHIVACSHQVRERLIQFGVAAEKISVLYPAVDLERFRPREVPQKYLEEKGLAGRRILLTVGRVIERKGHDQVLRALPRIARHFPDVLYCIVGIGPYEKKLREEINRFNLADRVRLMGKVSDEELVFLYNACEIFAMPSREIQKGGHIEGFGIVYLEANACGKPVIGGKSGGVIEAVREGQTGFLVDPDSPDDLAEKAVWLLSNPEQAKEMGRLGLQWVRSVFGWEGYVRQAHHFLGGGETK